jgi:predicted MFS family arabinose efflux permease
MVQRPPQGDPARRLVFLAVASAALHGALVLVAPAGSVALGLALLVAGAVVAPAFATAYGMTSRIAPAGTATEAFSWLSTGIAVGIAAGSALAGALADGPGPRLAFAVGAAAPLLSAALVWLRRRDLCRAG